MNEEIGYLQLFEYKITEDPEFIQEMHHMPRELQMRFRSLRSRASRGGRRIIRKLNELIEQYPHVPQLKNYLSCAYQARGMMQKAFEINQKITIEHPDYLFGKINLADEYYHKEQYDRIPEVLGRSMELKLLYPERDCFHLYEVTGFLRIAIMYFCATGNLKAAEQRFDMLKKLDPDHPLTEDASILLMEARMDAGIGSQEEDEQNAWNKAIDTEEIPGKEKMSGEEKIPGEEEMSGEEKISGKEEMSGPEEVTESIHVKPKIGRNDPCPCGSGKKYKNCCLQKERNN